MANTKGYVRGLNISTEKGTIKTPIEKGMFLENHGLEGDAHAGNWHRQISLLSVDSIEIMKKQGASNLTYGSFAENITTEGIVLYELPVGTKLKIGDTLQEVTQIGKKCHSGCQISKEVGNCIMPKQGIFTKILKSGEIKVGDTIEIL